MFNLELLEKAQKFNVNINTYNNAINWLKNVNEINLSNDIDRNNLVLLDKLENEINQAEINWLKANKDNLLFDVQFEDKGYVFVDVLEVYDNKNNKVYEQWFYGDGESQEFIDMIYA
jgi:hypothetical protein